MAAKVQLLKQTSPMTTTTRRRQLLPTTKRSLTANDDRYDLYDKKSNMQTTNKSLRSSTHAYEKALECGRQLPKAKQASHQEYNVKLRQISHHLLSDASSSHESLTHTQEDQKAADGDCRNTWTRSTRAGS